MKLMDRQEEERQNLRAALEMCHQPIRKMQDALEMCHQPVHNRLRSNQF